MQWLAFAKCGTINPINPITPTIDTKKPVAKAETTKIFGCGASRNFLCYRPRDVESNFLRIQKERRID